VKEQKLNVIQTWSKFANLLLKLKEAWDEHQEVWMVTSREEIQNLPLEWQKFVARNFNRSEFNIMLPRLVDFWRGLGGIEALRIELNPDEILESMKKDKEKEKK